jgi:hypothetical protein
LKSFTTHESWHDWNGLQNHSNLKRIDFTTSMGRSNGFIQLRRGIWEHVRDGRMSLMAALAFIYICSQADTRTGIWKGSAGALAGELGMQPRTARDALERLECGNYIRRFVKPGARFCYPILVHKFLITQGEHDGKVVDALSSSISSGCVDVRYISCEVHGEVHSEVHASQRRSDTRNEKINIKISAPSAPASPSHLLSSPDLDDSSPEGVNKPLARKNMKARTSNAEPDQRFKLVFDPCYELYRDRRRQPPTWGSKEAGILKRFLGEQVSITSEEIVRRYGHLLDSTDPWHAGKGGSLAHLLANFDVFVHGPIHKETPKSFDRIRRDENDAATARVIASYQEQARKYDAIDVTPRRLQAPKVQQPPAQLLETSTLIRDISEEEAEAATQEARRKIFGNLRPRIPKPANDFQSQEG